MRSKQYFTSIKNNPHEISTDPNIGHEDEWEQFGNKLQKRAKYLIYKYLALFLVPRPGTSHRNHRKTKEFIFLIINYLHISCFLHFCPILPVFCYSVHF